MGSRRTCTSVAAQNMVTTSCMVLLRQRWGQLCEANADIGGSDWTLELHSFTHTHKHRQSTSSHAYKPVEQRALEGAKETDNEKNIDSRMYSAALLLKDRYWSWATSIDAVGIHLFHCCLLDYYPLLTGWTELAKVSHIAGQLLFSSDSKFSFFQLFVLFIEIKVIGASIHSLCIH